MLGFSYQSDLAVFLSISSISVPHCPRRLQRKVFTISSSAEGILRLFFFPHWWWTKKPKQSNAPADFKYPFQLSSHFFHLKDCYSVTRRISQEIIRGWVGRVQKVSVGCS